jgi:hypothetical protein
MEERRGPDIVGRIDVSTKRDSYRHAAEHRGGGIVCIYSYGPAREHERIVRSAAAVMRARFGVSGAVTSGGISGWPEDEFSGGPSENRTIETQTIFCIDAVGGPNRRKPREVPPAKADWHVNYIADWGQDYLADGDMDVYLTGPLLDPEEWEALVTERVDGAEIVEAKVCALSQGRYWFLSDKDPVHEWRG